MDYNPKTCWSYKESVLSLYLNSVCIFILYLVLDRCTIPGLQLKLFCTNVNINLMEQQLESIRFSWVLMTGYWSSVNSHSQPYWHPPPLHTHTPFLLNCSAARRPVRACDWSVVAPASPSTWTHSQRDWKILSWPFWKTPLCEHLSWLLMFWWMKPDKDKAKGMLNLHRPPDQDLVTVIWFVVPPTCMSQYPGARYQTPKLPPICPSQRYSVNVRWKVLRHKKCTCLNVCVNRWVRLVVRECFDCSNLTENALYRHQSII